LEVAGLEVEGLEVKGLEVKGLEVKGLEVKGLDVEHEGAAAGTPKGPCSTVSAALILPG
jgi:hypothetical protein